MDRLDAMQVLLAVVDAGSLSAGSRALNTPLPTVSRKVAELEQLLGTRLLIRTSRNVQLTDAGRDYVDAIRPIVAQLHEAERRASGEYDEPRGQLTITVPSELGRLVVVPLVYDFLEEHRDISVDVLTLERYVDLVEEKVDVGVRLGVLPDSSLYAVKVGDLAVSTCVSPIYLERRGRPAHPADLVDHDGILYRYPNTATWTYLVNGVDFEAFPKFRVRANTASTCRQAAMKGFGVARLFDFQIEDELRSGELVRLLEEFEYSRMPVHLVYVKQRLLPLKTRVFLDWMSPRLRQRLKGFDTRTEAP
jgi:DNA-binding transcriptional LysR family regulator